MTVYKEDQGQHFGHWGDPVSSFMYQQSLDLILPFVRLEGCIGDYGGANGMLKEHVPNVITIDIDETKNPDIVDDILTHAGVYDTGWCRYVMHYLTDQQVIDFVHNVNVRRMVVVQFTNQDLTGKYVNSGDVESTKYFRTAEQMLALLPVGTVELMSFDYVVTAEFYKNRFGVAVENFYPHHEQLKVYEVFL